MAHATTTSKADNTTVAAHILCDACSRVFRESKWVQQLAGRASGDDVLNRDHVDIFLHSFDKDQLRKSSAAGCHLCTMIIEDDPDWDDADETGVIQAEVACNVFAEVDEDKISMILTRIINILASDFPSGDHGGIEIALREQGKLGWQERQPYESPISDVSLHRATGKCTRNDHGPRLRS